MALAAQQLADFPSGAVARLACVAALLAQTPVASDSRLRLARLARVAADALDTDADVVGPAVAPALAQAACLWRLALLLLLPDCAPSVTASLSSFDLCLQPVDPSSEAESFDPNAPVLLPLLTWLNSALSPNCPSEKEFRTLANAPVPDASPSYWFYVKRCILRNHLFAAASMLSKHSAFSQSNSSSSASTANPLVILVSLIHAFPSRSKFSSQQQFLAQWDQWHRTAASYKDKGRLMAIFANVLGSNSALAGHLAECFGILAGDAQIIAQTSVALDEYAKREGRNEDYPWVEALVACICYSDPLCSNAGIASHSETIRSHMLLPPSALTLEGRRLTLPDDINEMADDDDLVDGFTVFEQAIMALLELDIEQAVITHLTKIDHGAAAHLVHLLARLAELDARDGFDSLVYFASTDAGIVVAVASGASVTGTASEASSTAATTKTVTTTLAEHYMLAHARAIARTSPDIAMELLGVLMSSTGSLRAREELAALILARQEAGASATRRELRKLAAIAAQHSLHAVVTALYERTAADARARGRLGECVAAHFASRHAEWRARVDAAARDMLARHVDARSDATRREIVQLAPDVVRTSDCAAVAVKVVEFQDAMDAAAPPLDDADLANSVAKDEKSARDSAVEAGAALLELLTRLPTPPKIIGMLLVDAVDLLEHNDGGVFGVDETFELMRCLQGILDNNITWTGRGVCSTRRSKTAMETETTGFVGIEHVRLALSKNLARAVMASV
ncbi:hypothetical protein HDU83_002622 [Entophlyctis luteolus]|nr:hypothetical protein HDU83_002622 [Entophlyctis luteolus]